MTLSDAANTVLPAGSSQGEGENCETEGAGSPELLSTPVSTNVPAVNGEAAASSTSDSAENIELEVESPPSAPLLHKEGEGKHKNLYLYGSLCSVYIEYRLK